MQQALPYINWLPIAPPTVTADPIELAAEVGEDARRIRHFVSENSVVVFARRGCCMCHVVKLLLNGHGVNPSIFDIDEDDEAGVTVELSRITGKSVGPKLPAVFVGGELIGGLEDIMGAHISGDLVPRLREARALWL